MHCVGVKVDTETIESLAKRAYCVFFSANGEEPPLQWEELSNSEQWRWVSVVALQT